MKLNQKSKIIIKIILIGVFLMAVFYSTSAFSANERIKLNINMVWKFKLGDLTDNPYQVSYNDSTWDDIALPHTLKETSLFLDNSMDTNYQQTFHRYVGWYRKHLNIPSEYLSKKIFLEFQGVMQVTDLWVNGTHVGRYEVSGYDTFHYDITSLAKSGDNLIAVKVDNRVNNNTPPDGTTMQKDFILFGGIYRDVFLVVTDKLHVNFSEEAINAGIRITYPTASTSAATVKVNTTVKNETGAAKSCTVTTEIRDKNDNLVTSMTTTQSISNSQTYTFSQTSSTISNPNLWSPDNPYLYKAVTLISDGTTTVDRLETRFGIRWFSFTTTTGFYLNGKHLKLIGVNRHQTWPYVGNAVPNEIHRRDAEQMKSLGINWVRCSHYPHDPEFLDDLDELGLLALEEPPTWIGSNGTTWMSNLEKSYRYMIRRDRNHPSVIIWGACINHGPAEPSLVTATYEEDYRPAGQQDVPLPHDFTHLTVSGNGALTTEHTGHKFPRGRGEIVNGQRGEWQLAQQHWEQTDATYKKTDNCGTAVWCMYDYNTFHNTSDDRNMVHHGVFDLQRIPKLETYYWHISELTKSPMIYVSKYSDTGVTVFSNCDQVRLSQDTGSGYTVVGTKNPDSGFVLNHPPFSFTVSSSVIKLKAEGLVGGTVKATNEWLKPGTAKALKLEADRSSIFADGSDFSRIIVSVVDANGTLVPSATNAITFKISGSGRLIGDNPVNARAGMNIILAAANYQTGTITITATASGLTSASVNVTINQVPAGYDIPGSIPTPPPATLSPTPTISDNLALNKTASADSEQAVNPAVNGNDGITTSRWCAIDSSLNHWWKVDLGSSYNLSGSEVVWEKSGVVYKYKIETSADNATWTLKVDKTNNTSTAQTQADSFTGTARYVRITVTGLATGSWASFYEFRVFGATGASTPTPTPTPTVTPDSVPNSFTFIDVTNAELSTLYTSNPIMITGINIGAPISVTGGEYQINTGGVWTNAPGTIYSGDEVKVRLTSAAGNNTKVSAVLNIGGVTDSFDVTTKSQSGDNLALNKPVTCSSEQTGNEANHINDGDATTTRWSASPYPQWVRIDLGTSYNINQTELVPYSNRAYQYRIEVSTDGTNFTQVVDKTGNTTGSALLTDTFAAVNARYIRLSVTGCSGYTGTWASINEFRVYGNGSSATPTVTPTATVTATPSVTPTPIVTPTPTASSITNLALNKPVAYSSEQTGNEAIHINDGDATTTRWSASPYPQWVRIDLGATYNISKTELVPYSNRAYQYRVEVSTDGTNFTQVVDQTGNTTSGALLTDTFAIVSARYVRLSVIGCYNYTGTWASVVEFRVF